MGQKIQKYMLDTNIFNQIADGLIPLDNLKDRALYATHVQRDELERTKNPDRRSKLLKMFHFLEAQITPTHTAVWDDSKWDQTRWPSEDGCYESLLMRIRELDNLSGKKPSDKNISRDARIAETAIKEKYVLVTKDLSLATAAAEKGCAVSSDFE